jgi:two-component system NtrC family sensor kinase
LKQLLLTKIEDTSSVKVLAELARSYIYSKPDTALTLAQQGIVLAKQVEFIRGEAMCLNSLGAIFGLTGNYPKALEHHLQA